MKKLIIVSDTHGNPQSLSELLPLIAENDYVVHLGDGAVDMREVCGVYPEKVYACRGNCDLFYPVPEDGELEVEGVKIYFCHGHQHGVKSNLYALCEEAKRRDCQIALYGHTHIASIMEMDGVTLINPGSLRFSAKKGGSYCYLVVNKNSFTPVIVGEQYL